MAKQPFRTRPSGVRALVKAPAYIAGLSLVAKVRFCKPSSRVRFLQPAPWDHSLRWLESRAFTPEEADRRRLVLPKNLKS